MIEPWRMVRAIQAAARVEAVPFELCSLKCVFPDGFYGELMSSLPASDRYVELRHKDAKLPNGRYARLVFPLTRESLCSLDRDPRRALTACADALRHPSLKQALARRFAATLARRGIPPRCETKLEVLLLRDLPGYSIRPHQDIPRKLFNVQVYLPSDEATSHHLGTTFYRRIASGGLEKVFRMPYAPNSGYAFAVSTDSWHGVDPIAFNEAPRDSLMLTWTLDDPWLRLRASAQLAARVVRSQFHPVGTSPETPSASQVAERLFRDRCARMSDDPRDPSRRSSARRGGRRHPGGL